MQTQSEIAPRCISSAHGIYLTIDANVSLDESQLVGCKIFPNRAVMAEDMFFDPHQNCYGSVEEADAVIYRITHSPALGELVLVDDRGVPAPLDSTLEDFLNTYQL